MVLIINFEMICQAWKSPEGFSVRLSLSCGDVVKIVIKLIVEWWPNQIINSYFSQETLMTFTACLIMMQKVWGRHDNRGQYCARASGPSGVWRHIRFIQQWRLPRREMVGQRSKRRKRWKTARMKVGCWRHIATSISRRVLTSCLCRKDEFYRLIALFTCQLRSATWLQHVVVSPGEWMSLQEQCYKIGSKLNVFVTSL